mmetsp:Transcript_12397/g.15702  ORF Transcript_12397/g.15702 Transcript_12397/m.15702 type:complete len:245 (-) Transcript_12397:104-838(-)
MSKMSSSLKEFDNFHSMVCQPKAAQRCVDEFKSKNGCILFMPTSYCSTRNRDDKKSRDIIANYDGSILLNLLSYYALVVASFTGLCTLLGMTDTVEMEEYSGQGDRGVQVWPLEKSNHDISLLARSSKKEPLIRIEDSVFKYMEDHVYRYTTDQKVAKMSLDDSGPKFYLKRKFEYHFRLVSLHVIMVHFSCTYKGHTNLHLVEVYHIKNPFLRFTLGTVFDTMAKLLRHITCGSLKNTKAKNK